MKRLLLLIPLLSIAWTPPSGNVTLQWVYPTNTYSADLVYQIRGTNIISAPISSWPILTNVPGNTNTLVGTNYVTQCIVTIQPGPFFFTCVASNFWGVADPSNVVLTPPLPQSNINLIISRGP